MIDPKPDVRVMALRRFAIAITVLNILGRTVFGFEQPWSYVVAALATTYGMELLLEWLAARDESRPVRYGGGWRCMVDFLLSAHITGLAISMLVYANHRIWPIVFASAVAIGSKTLFRAPHARGERHFLNPSNFGISVALVLFPAVSIVPPYHFTENIYGIADLLIPVIIVISGSFLNIHFTKRLPLILGWIGGFVLQAALGTIISGHLFGPALLPMTSVAFTLFTFYMITDPGTTPSKPWHQCLFGLAVALVYRLLMMANVVFDLFFALSIVCMLRGAWLYYLAWAAKRSSIPIATSNLAPRVEA
jgi:enediyne biosynthesis protein E5